MSYVSRPILVTLIGGIYFLTGLAAIVLGVLSVIGLVPSDSLGELAGMGSIAIIVGLIPLVIGYGFLKGWRIFWILGVVFSILGIIASLASFVFLGLIGIVPLLVDALVLYYLTRPKVKTFFKM